MKSASAAVMVAVVFVSVAFGQVSQEELAERARAARSVAVGVNLIKWDQSQPSGGWQRWWARAEQAPGFAVDVQRGAKGLPGLVLSGAKRPHVFGGWKYTIKRVDPGKYYRFLVLAEAKVVSNVRRNILCRVRWTGKDLGNEMTPDYITSHRKGQGFLIGFDQKFIAPEKAEGAVIELLIQDVPAGEVAFKEVAFEMGRPAEGGLLRVAAVNWPAPESATVDENIAALGALIDKAAEGNPDVVLLPDKITSLNTGLSPEQAAEVLPGKAFLALAAKAKQHNCYVIYGAYERDGADVYSTAVILNRDGTLAGKCRQVQVTPEEAEAGVAAGDYFRTFELDFGRVGVLLSHECLFAESARVLLLDGAEIIFVPMTREDKRDLEARARDNGLWLAAAGVRTPSIVVDPRGQVTALAFGEIGEGVAARAISLTKRVRRPWIGDWRNQIVKQRRSDAYLKLVQE
ncbi:MAG: carbon-nitrogen hydrolase family protein [Planctomycetota bacterium]|jgi:predicted amidohydrolase